MLVPQAFDPFTSLIAISENVGLIELYLKSGNEYTLINSILTSKYSEHTSTTINKLTWSNYKQGNLLASCDLNGVLLIWKIWKDDHELLYEYKDTEIKEIAFCNNDLVLLTLTNTGILTKHEYNSKYNSFNSSILRIDVISFSFLNAYDSDQSYFYACINKSHEIFLCDIREIIDSQKLHSLKGYDSINMIKFIKYNLIGVVVNHQQLLILKQKDEYVWEVISNINNNKTITSIEFTAKEELILKDTSNSYSIYKESINNKWINK